MASTIGGYELGEVLGRGAMGEVRVAHRHGSDTAYAVKVLRAELADDPTLIARFVQEREIMCSLDDPHLVKVHDLVVEGGAAAIVMDLVDGSDLRKTLTHAGTIEPARATDIVAQLSSGLEAVHARKIVHRDVKPENILVDSHGSVRLTDFGIARLTHGPALTRLTGLIGTPEYLAPELAEREHATGAADVYSAGIVLYELLTGHTPFAGVHPVAVLQRHIQEAPHRPDGLPDSLWAQLEAMLAKDPDARPSAANAADSLRALVPALADIAALPTSDTATRMNKRSRRAESDSVGRLASVAAAAPAPPISKAESDTVERTGTTVRGGHRGFTPLSEVVVADDGHDRRRAMAGIVLGVAAAAALALVLVMALGSKGHSKSPAAFQNTTTTTTTTSHTTTSSLSVTTTSGAHGGTPTTSLSSVLTGRPPTSQRETTDGSPGLAVAPGVQVPSGARTTVPTATKTTSTTTTTASAKTTTSLVTTATQPNRTAITSYYQPNGGAPYWGTAPYAFQNFVANSNTITTIGVTWGSAAWQAGDSTQIQLCQSVGSEAAYSIPCNGLLAQGNAPVANYGTSSVDMGDIAVTPGTTYYVVFYQPQSAQGSWYCYWWQGGWNEADSNAMVMTVQGYNR